LKPHTWGVGGGGGGGEFGEERGPTSFTLIDVGHLNAKCLEVARIKREDGVRAWLGYDEIGGGKQARLGKVSRAWGLFTLLSL